MFPSARIGDLTATGDVITGPGMATVLIGGKPAACVGDLVAGTFMTGTIVAGSATVMIGGRPAVELEFEQRLQALLQRWAPGWLRSGRPLRSPRR